MERVAIGLRMSPARPAPATPDRRIAGWQAFHRICDLVSTFSRPLVQQARQKARRANARPRVPKSPEPAMRDNRTTLIAPPLRARLHNPNLTDRCQRSRSAYPSRSGRALVYFSCASAKLDSMDATPSSRVSFDFRKRS